MSFWEVFAIVITGIVGGAGTSASIFGVFYTVASRRNGRETREFFEEGRRETAANFQRMDEGWQRIAQQIEEGRERSSQEIQLVLQRMDEGWQKLNQQIETGRKETQNLLAQIDGHIEEGRKSTEEFLRHMDARGAEQHAEALRIMDGIQQTLARLAQRS